MRESDENGDGRMICYKATRTDGTDFYTGTVDYAGALASGEPLPLLTSEYGVYKCCTDSVYHASDVPAETLVGCSWPCRLFEVTGTPVDQEGRKFGFRTLTVVREVESWRALGPNGESVAALIERARETTVEQVRDLGDAWDAARDAAGNAAWGAARGAAWVAARGAARGAAWDAAWVAARGATWAAAWAATWAAQALVVRDLISEEDFNTLYGPWASVMGVS